MFQRTFIAIKIIPAEELLRRVYYLKSNLNSSLINWINSNQLHLTLRFVGQTPQDIIDDISSELAKELTLINNFEISLSGLSIFGSSHQPKVIYAKVEPNENLKEIAQIIDQILLNFNFTNDRQNFVPHITLGRIKKLDDRQYFQKVIDKKKNVFIQTSEVNQIIFYKSKLTQRGAIYHPLKEIKLKT